jgi:hypothetical protein
MQRGATVGGHEILALAHFACRQAGSGAEGGRQAGIRLGGRELDVKVCGRTLHDSGLFR